MRLLLFGATGTVGQHIMVQALEKGHQAMRDRKIDRFICQTSLGCGESWGNLNFFWKYIMFGWFLMEPFTDHQEQEKHSISSRCDWTIIRPAAFTNGELMKQFRSGFFPDDTASKLKISRADLAYFILQQLDHSENLRKKVGISY